MKKILLCGLVFLSVVVPSFSRTFESVEQEKNKHSITIGFDPFIPIFLQGIEIEGIYNWGKNRFGIEFINGNLPLALWNFQINDFNKVRSSVIEFSYGRFLKNTQNGFHYGVAFSRIFDYSVSNGKETLRKSIFKLGVRVGYLWEPFENTGFFVEPLFNLGVYINDIDLVFDTGQEFQSSIFAGSGPIVHVGYKYTF